MTMTAHEITTTAQRCGWNDLETLITTAVRVYGPDWPAAFALCKQCGELTIDPQVWLDGDSDWGEETSNGVLCRRCVNEKKEDWPMELDRNFTSDKYSGPVVADCWIVLSSRGLTVQWDTGDGFVDYSHISPDDVVGGAANADIHEVEDDPEPLTTELAALYEDWLCEPGVRYEFFDAILKAVAVPCCNLDEEDGFDTLRHSRRDRMLHDPNFHSGLYGATRDKKWQVASDLCGIDPDEDEEQED